jgi:hypothetical protein
MFNQEDMEVLPINIMVLPQGGGLVKKKKFQAVKVWLGKDYFFAKW